MAGIYEGDNEAVLRGFPSSCIDGVVTGPPYGLSDPPDIEEVLEAWLRGERYEHSKAGFMGERWDGFVPGPDIWREVCRVLKPGGHLVVFASSRMMDLTGISLRLGGLRIRDALAWLNSQGLPKGYDLGRISERWSGWNTQLKGAYEEIFLAQKPLSEGSIRENVERWGVGGLNTHSCRFSTDWHPGKGEGRIPANVVMSHHEECYREGVKRVAEATQGPVAKGRAGGRGIYGDYGEDRIPHAGFGDKDGLEEVEEWHCVDQCVIHDLNENPEVRQPGHKTPHLSRFYYCTKAARRERYFRCRTCDGVYPKRRLGIHEGHDIYQHPAQHPLDLIRWLMTLVVPPGGHVLDPYMGTGTTGVAALELGYEYTGIDRDPDSVAIARYRIGVGAKGKEGRYHWCEDVPLPGEVEGPDLTGEGGILDLFGGE